MSTTDPLKQAFAQIEQTSYSADQAAEILGLRVQTIRSHIAAGRLNAVRGPSRVRITEEEIDRYLRHQKTWRTRRGEADDAA